MKKYIYLVYYLIQTIQFLVRGSDGNNGKIYLKKNIYLIKIFFSDNFFINLKNKRNIFLIIYYIFLYLKFLITVLLNCTNSRFIIFRNCTIGGPPIIEIFLYLIGKKIIFDFDDAIQYGSENNNSWFFQI